LFPARYYLLVAYEASKLASVAGSSWIMFVKLERKRTGTRFRAVEDRGRCRRSVR
jgi:hypothetical protein